MTLSVETAPCSVAELPLFDGGPYPASVRAIGAVGTLFLNKTDFQQACRQNPEVALKVLAVVGQRLRHLVAVVESVTFGSVTGRLARLLLEAARQAGSDAFDLPATHQEMASRLGTVREVVSRNLARLRAEGIVRVDDRRAQILDRAALEREAEAAAAFR